MTEKRSSTRKYLEQIIQVRDVVTGDTLGQIGNFSAEGLMLITKKQIKEDRTYQVEFDLNLDGDDSHLMQVAIHCLWSLPANTLGLNWAGFEVIDAAPEDIRLLGELSSKAS